MRKTHLPVDVRSTNSSDPKTQSIPPVVNADVIVLSKDDVKKGEVRKQG